MNIEQLQNIKEQLQKNKAKELAEQEKIELEKKAKAAQFNPDSKIIQANDENDAWQNFIESEQGIKLLGHHNYVSLKKIPEYSEEAYKLMRQAAEEEPSKEITEFSLLNVRFLEPSDIVGFKKDGVQHGVYMKLKHGEYAIKARLDLHNHSLEEALLKTTRFINLSYERGYRSVIIVHGKGENTSPKAFLKSHVFAWMKQSEIVLATHHAMPYHGGAGALYVLLKKNPQMKFENSEKYR